MALSDQLRWPHFFRGRKIKPSWFGYNNGLTGEGRVRSEG